MNTGPFWTNFFTDPPEEEVCGELNEVLETLGVSLYKSNEYILIKYIKDKNKNIF